MKVALMGIPTLLSRSGVTQMGLDLAQELGVTMVARAKGRHFLVYSGSDQLIFDAPPAERPAAADSATRGGRRPD
jgi:FdhD protein